MTVMRILDQFRSEPETCQYLPDRRATLEHVLVGQLTPSEYEGLMDRGWRKFGPALFHPVCESCAECRPIRIDAQGFTADRSQRRAWRRNADLRVCYAPPTIDAARLNLYRRYHASQAALKGWPDTERTAQGYRFQFVQNPIPSVEISVWEGETLRAIALAQRLGKRWVYFGFYVAGCGSMAYKTRFRPYEILGTDGVWSGRTQD